MGIVRRPWRYKNPATGKIKKFWTTPDLVRFIESIEDPDIAEDFFAEYEKVAPPDLAEHNMAYLIGLIRDPDIREDAADLFMINFAEHMNKGGGITPEHIFFSKNGGSCLGIKMNSEEVNEATGNRKVTKIRKVRV